MLCRLSKCLDPVRVRELAGKFEKETDQTRAAEWEVAIGYALTHVGKIEGFQQQRGGNPDFVWTLQERPIIVEVTSISDASLHDHNPVQLFTGELGRIAAKHGITQRGTFSYQFGSVQEQDRITVAVPTKKDHVQFFQHPDFSAFLKQVRREPLRQHTYTFFERGAASTISYQPGKRFSSGSYPSYTAPQTYRHPPIFNALKKKERQIKESGVTQPAILFICDNDCDALSQAHTGTAGDRLGMRDIVGLFLNGQRRQMIGDLIWKQGVPAQASRIHAVIWISVKERWEMFSPNRILSLSVHIEYADYAEPYLRTGEFLNQLNQALSCLPIPLQAPRNAGMERRYPKHYGGWTMSTSEVKFSALTLQKLLTGEISYAEFVCDHADLVAHLRYLADQGSMIDFATIDICENEDDDWIRFGFGGLNPDKLFARKKS